MPNVQADRMANPLRVSHTVQPLVGLGGFDSILRSPAGQLRCLRDPTRHKCLVELIGLVNVEIAHLLLCGLARRDRTQARPTEERNLDVLGEAVKSEKPALTLNAIEGRVPSHGLAYARHNARDERVETLPNVALPAGHRVDIRLHRGVAVGLRDLRVAAGKQSHRLGLGGRSACLGAGLHMGLVLENKRRTM